MEFLTKFNNFPTRRFAGADFGNDLPGKSQANSRAILGPFSGHFQDIIRNQPLTKNRKWLNINVLP